jgi:hypothetical protein
MKKYKRSKIFLRKMERKKLYGCPYYGHSRQWQKEHPAQFQHIGKRWKESNPEKYKQLYEQWLKNKTERINTGARNRSRTLKGKLNGRMSTMIYLALRKNKARYRWETLVGYTVDDLRKHLESRFKDGMTWDLFRQGKIHIDHIIPRSFFSYNKPEDQEFQYCWSLDNLQPLWARDNRSKHNKIINPQK